MDRVAHRSVEEFMTYLDASMSTKDCRLVLATNPEQTLTTLDSICEGDILILLAGGEIYNQKPMIKSETNQEDELPPLI